LWLFGISFSPHMSKPNLKDINARANQVLTSDCEFIGTYFLRRTA